jgi:hypothetical protein
MAQWINHGCDGPWRSGNEPSQQWHLTFLQQKDKKIHLLAGMMHLIVIFRTRFRSTPSFSKRNAKLGCSTFLLIS